eukprot:c38368_g1_i1 orf=3-194(-)
MHLSVSPSLYPSLCFFLHLFLSSFPSLSLYVSHILSSLSSFSLSILVSLYPPRHSLIIYSLSLS